MKKQTFIAFLYDTDGKQVGFERFCDKRTSTITRKMMELWTESELYRICTKTARTVKVYATPDGYHEAADPVAVFDLYAM